MNEQMDETPLWKKLTQVLTGIKTPTWKKKKNVLFCSKKGFSQVTGILKLGGRGRQLLEHRPELHLPQICPSFLAAGAKRTSGRRQLLCR